MNIPLYLYHEDGTRSTNLNGDLLKEFTHGISVDFQPEDILDYIYASLHSPKYRSLYKEYLKVDFPRIPKPKDNNSFVKLVELGRELRLIHLMESSKTNLYTSTFPISGSDVVDKIEYKDGNVYINNEQFFGNVPQTAWKHFIGGYQPAQKWLKDRKGLRLSDEDLQQYQRIIVALVETERIMKEIDKVEK